MGSLRDKKGHVRSIQVMSGHQVTSGHQVLSQNRSGQCEYKVDCIKVQGKLVSSCLAKLVHVGTLGLQQVKSSPKLLTLSTVTDSGESCS